MRFVVVALPGLFSCLFFIHLLPISLLSSFIRPRHSYPLALLILIYKFSIFPFLLVALIVCIVMIVICVPNNGVCPIQVVTQDADMTENINLNG